MKTLKVLGLGTTLIFLTTSHALAMPEAAAAVETAPAAPALMAVSIAEPLPFVPVTLTTPELKTPAYLRYQRRPSSEISKLIYLGDVIKDSGQMIYFNGHTFDPRLIAPLVTAYVRSRYRNETAKDWVLDRAYRLGPSNAIIYLKDRNGKLAILRDFLIEELKNL